MLYVLFNFISLHIQTCFIFHIVYLSKNDNRLIFSFSIGLESICETSLEEFVGKFI